MNSNQSNIDSILTYILIKKLLTPINQSIPYKMGYVDITGKTINNNVTDNNFTLLDKVVYKLKRLLGTKLTILNKFLYVVTINNNFYNNLIVKGNVEQRGEIKRIQRDINGIMEKYNISLEKYLIGELNEQIEEKYLK